MRLSDILEPPMAKLTCPNCGTSGRLPRDRTPEQLRCKRCDARITIQRAAAPLPSQDEPPWHQDPYIRASIVFSSIVLVVFVGYLVWDQHRTHTRQELLAIKILGDRLDAEGKFEEAASTYEGFVNQAESWNDNEVREAVGSAIERRGRAQSVIAARRAEQQRLTAQRQRKAEARAWIWSGFKPARAVASATADWLLSIVPSGGTSDGNTYDGSGTVYVRGYHRKDGTYVSPHTRSAPRRR
jgi:hypothetical protein